MAQLLVQDLRTVDKPPAKLPSTTRHIVNVTKVLHMCWCWLETTVPVGSDSFERRKPKPGRLLIRDKVRERANRRWEIVVTSPLRWSQQTTAKAERERTVHTVTIASSLPLQNHVTSRPETNPNQQVMHPNIVNSYHAAQITLLTSSSSPPSSRP
jgi:hypothetical protein